MQSLQEWLRQPDQVSAHLRALRARAGLSGWDLARAHGWAQSKVSRIENGKQLPTASDVDAWATSTRASDDERDEPHRLRETAQVAHVSFRDRMRSGQAPVQRDYNDLVSRSQLIRHMETVWMPGLLQVPAYARRVLTEMREVGYPGVDDVEEAVATRMERQRALYDPGKRFEFLLAEPVLRWQLCPDDVMREQLHRLLSAMDLDNLRLGVVPLDRELRWTPVDTYQIYVGEETVTAVETLVGETFHRGPQSEVYGLLLDRLWSEAMIGDDARRLIEASLAGQRRGSG